MSERLQNSATGSRAQQMKGRAGAVARTGTKLAYLAPDITEAILDGRQPSELTAHRLKRMAGLPLGWPEQRNALGFV